MISVYSNLVPNFYLKMPLDTSSKVCCLEKIEIDCLPRPFNFRVLQMRENYQGIISRVTRIYKKGGVVSRKKA